MLDPSLAACAPFVAPATLESVISVESRGRPLAININRGPKLAPAQSAAEAVATARAWIDRGYSVDLGLMQVNSRNLRRLGYTVEQMFDPCTNVAAGATILAANYIEAAKRRGPGQQALLDALSAYNTGSFSRGYSNGYISRYFDLTGSIIRFRPSSPRGTSIPPNPYTAELSVYSRKDENADTGQHPDRSPQPGLVD